MLWDFLCIFAEQIHDTDTIMMKFLLMLLALVLTTGIHAQRGDRRPPRGGRPERTLETVDKEKLAPFAAKKIDTADGVLHYREAHIDAANGDKPALFIYMHGASGRGSDNTRQMHQLGIYSIYDYMQQHGIKGYFLVPQCPEANSWAGNREGKPYTEPVKKLINLYLEKGHVDSIRVYIFGVSMGGGGTWKLLSEMPGTFAGALIASGGYRDRDYKTIAQTPVYITVGSKEGKDRSREFQQLYEDIKQAGGEAKLDILEGLDHPETCVQSFTEERMGWVFGHTRNK